MQFEIENIIVPKGHRLLDQEKVAEIAASIKAIGLIVPIGIRRQPDGVINLVVGGHRLEACRSLGWEKIDAVDVNAACTEDDDLDDHARMVEIAENLHRSELTTSERNELLADWVALIEKRGPDIGDRRRYPGKPGRKPSQAVAKVAKVSGLSTKTVKEAIKTTQVSPEVKVAADKAELTAKQRLAVARLATEAEQLDAVSKQAATENKAQRDVSGPAKSLETLTVKRSSAAALAQMSDDERVDLLTELVQANDWLNKTAIDIAISGGANRGKLAAPSLRYQALTFLHAAIARIEDELAGREVQESADLKGNDCASPTGAAEENGRSR
jgi:ParB-like chromosome segregation protein Spo0J